MSSDYSSNKRSGGCDSHELSNKSESKSSRLGLRSVKYPYNLSDLRTRGNESQEDIIASEQQDGSVPRAPRQASGWLDGKSGQGITIKEEVDISTENDRQEVQTNWRLV